MKSVVIKSLISLLELVMFFIVFFSIDVAAVSPLILLYSFILYFALKKGISLKEKGRTLNEQIMQHLSWPAFILFFFFLTGSKEDLFISFVFSGIALIKAVALTLSN